MKYEYTGVVHEVQETQTFGSGFTKRDLVIIDQNPNTGFTQYIPFTFKKANCQKLDGIQPGQRVKITFALDGSQQPYNGRYFPTITGLAIEIAAVAGAAPAPAGAPAARTQAAQAAPAAAPGPKTWADFIDVWKRERPNQATDKAAIQAFVNQVMPELINAAKLSGQRFIDIAANNPGTFERLIAAVRPPVEDNPSHSMSADEMPF